MNRYTVTATINGYVAYRAQQVARDERTAIELVKTYYIGNITFDSIVAELEAEGVS